MVPPGPELPLPGQLLAHAATGAPLAENNRQFAWRPEDGDERQFRWVLEGGLGAMLHHAIRNRAAMVPPRGAIRC